MYKSNCVPKSSAHTKQQIPYLRKVLILYGVQQMNHFFRESLSIESKVCGMGKTPQAILMVINHN